MSTPHFYELTEERYVKILEAIPEATIIIDRDGIIIFLNSQLEKLFGYERSELLGKQIEILIPEPYRSRHPQHRNSYFNTPKIRPMGMGMKLFGQHKNGDVFPVEISLSPLDIKEGIVTVATIRDVSKRQLAEERFRRILEATPDATVIINEKGKINFVNTQTEKLFCYLPNELIGESLEILIPEVRPMEIGMKLFGLRKNGDQFPVEISLSPLETHEGKIVLATIRNITERVLLDKALQEKNIELEKANLAKDIFLSTMSHELRTPLNAIIGFTGTLLMKLPGPLNTDQEKQLNTIKRSAKHLLSLINDLLDLAKIESGKVELIMEKVDCQRIIKETISTLSPLAESKGLTLKAHFPDDAIIVNSNYRALTQIIINLVNNAIKFTDKGEITIRLEIQQKDNKNDIVFHIIDTGIGIKPEDQPKLFKAFQQISTPGKRAEGTGLGLHLSLKLVDLLHGKIEFLSEHKKGSQFSILIPFD